MKKMKSVKLNDKRLVPFFKPVFRILRRIWHDVFYILAGKRFYKVALTCEQATNITDVQTQNLSYLMKMRYFLHLSLCQFCKNYYDFSNLLKLTLKKKFNNQTANKNIESELKALNEELIKRHSSCTHTD